MMDDAKNTYKVPTPQDSLESQIMDPNFPKNEREWWASEEITHLRAEVEALTAQLQSGESFHAVAVRQRDAAWREVEALKAEDARLRKTGQKENDELVQILGKALRYPKFVDDQSVFPGATEADGVCVPCHTGVSIADEAAAAIEALRADAERLTGERDVAIGMLAYWCVAVDQNGTGWDDWDEHYKDAMYRPCPIRELLDKEIDAARAAQGERG